MNAVILATIMGVIEPSLAEGILRGDAPIDKIRWKRLEPIVFSYQEKTLGIGFVGTLDDTRIFYDAAKKGLIPGVPKKRR